MGRPLGHCFSRRVGLRANRVAASGSGADLARASGLTSAFEVGCSARRMRQSLEVRDVFLGQVLESAFQQGISYRLEHKLGEGATAVAYLAKRQGPNGEWPAVIKIIQPHIVK